ncbi:MAG TPA: GNAT family N-acetyltransferase [Pyrinomonadaceae bacterium]|nr:GNAT family N-acetyltransferase [Pyrinomonadaceae bacterium]
MNKILETERLIIRELTVDDAEFVLDLLNQPSFLKYIGDRGVRDVEQSRAFIESRYRQSYRDNGYGLYAVELKGDGTPIGMCGFVRRDSLPGPDIGFAFLPQYEKKGYGFESADAVMEYGRKTLRFDRVLAITSQDNEASGRLLEKIGFHFDGPIQLTGDNEVLKLFVYETETSANGST